MEEFLDSEELYDKPLLPRILNKIGLAGFLLAVVLRKVYIENVIAGSRYYPETVEVAPYIGWMFLGSIAVLITSCFTDKKVFSRSFLYLLIVLGFYVYIISQHI